jgi:hypothetical protein
MIIKDEDYALTCVNAEKSDERFEFHSVRQASVTHGLRVCGRRSCFQFRQERALEGFDLLCVDVGVMPSFLARPTGQMVEERLIGG